MKQFKEILVDLNACTEAIEWASDKTIEQVVAECHRGDWLLWLAKKVGVGIVPLTLAKGHCANTVRHLMGDERSIKAVDVAIAFGDGNASREELDSASADAFAAAYAAAHASADAAAYAHASAAAYADAYASAVAHAYAHASAVAHAYAAAHAAAHASASAAAYAAAAINAAAAAAADADANRMQTADICRKYIGELIIEKVKEMQA